MENELHKKLDMKTVNYNISPIIRICEKMSCEHRIKKPLFFPGKRKTFTREETFELSIE